MKTLIHTTSLLLFSALFQFNVYGQSKDVTSEFVHFPKEGGYEVGTFVKIYKKGISSPIIERQRLERVICTNKQVIELGPTTSLPSYRSVSNYTKAFRAALSTDKAFKDADANVRTNLRKVKYVEQVVNKAYRQSFADGTIALDDIIDQLPASELEKILRVMKYDKKRMFMVSEIVVVSDGSYKYVFDGGLTVDGKLAMQKFFTAMGTAQWTAGDSLEVTYDAPVVTQYKAIEISKPFVKRIEDEISERAAKGDVVCYRNPFTIRVEKFLLTDVGDGTDDDEDMDFGYEIAFLDHKGAVIDRLTNYKNDVYVWEPRKAGGEKDGEEGNRFFVGDSKTVTGNVYGITCTVSVKSRDSDGKEIWGKKGASMKQTFTINALEPTFSIKPWNCMELKLSVNY